MYLVEFSKVGKLIIEDDGIYAVPEFYEILTTKGMGEKAMRVIALVHDYSSPYRHRPDEDRPTFVIRDVYGKEAKKTVDLDSLLMTAAMAKYRILQYDPYREEFESTKKIIQQTISLKNSFEIKEDNLQKIESLIKRIEKFEERFEKLKKIIEENGDEGPVKKKISLFRMEEKYQNELILNN